MKTRTLAITAAATFCLASSVLTGAQDRAPAPRTGPAAPKTAPQPAPRGTPPSTLETQGSKVSATDRAPQKPGQRSNSPIVIDADRMEALKKEGLVIFTGNVVAKQDNSTQTADRMEVYLDDKGERVLRIISTGNVRIVTEDCRTGTAKRAEYYDDDQKLLLIGDAKVWQEDNVVTGERITIYLAEDRSVVEGGQQERVKAVFYPKSQDEAAARPKTQPGQCP